MRWRNRQPARHEPVVDVGLQRTYIGRSVGRGCWRKHAGVWCAREPVNAAGLCDPCADDLRTAEEHVA